MSLQLLRAFIIGTMISYWSVWGLQSKLVAMGTIVLALHVLEEWRFPGGFHYMYNIMKDSDLPDRYPMNQPSDMWTNWLGIIFGCFCLIIGITPLLATMQLLLCLGEMQSHFSGGVFVKKRFKAQGKQTIYNPGLFTTLFGYIPLAIALIVSFFVQQAPTLAK